MVNIQQIAYFYYLPKNQIIIEIMDLHFILNYRGLTQLLVYSPWNKSKKNFTEKFQQFPQKDFNSSANKIIGFVPYNCTLNQQQKEQNTSEIDSEEVQRDEDSESQGQEQKLGENQQKKKQSENGRTRKGPYKKYTTDQKKQAIQLINSGKDIKTISKQFNIPRRNLLRWRKNGCERKEGGGRPSDFVMEQKLFEMILKKQVTTEKQIREYALNMTNFKKFKASKGWYVKFWRRFRQYIAKTGRKQKQTELNIINLEKQC